MDGGPDRRLIITDALVVFLIAWSVAVAYRRIWPLMPGRDFETYVQYYVDMWQRTPTYPLLMVYRMPLTPLFIGGLAELGGSTAVTIAMNTCYAVAIVASYFIGAFWSRSVGWASAAVTLVYVGFGALHREVGSDVLFGTVFLTWCAWIAWSRQRLTVRTYVLHAVWVVVLTLIRPASQAFLVFAVFPWIIEAADIRTRIRCSAAFLATAVVLLGAFSTYNAVRYQDFTIARGSGAINPFYRTFVTDRIVREENGPASRELARAVRGDLLNHEPYVSYRVTDKMIFEDGGVRAWSDLTALSDRTWGWPSHYAILRRAAVEAIVAHPKPYITGVAHDTMATLGIIGYPPPVVRSALPEPLKPAPAGLPVPTEGQWVPHAYVHWLASSPTGHVNSMDAMVNGPRLLRIMATIPAGPGKPILADLLEKAQKMFPPPVIWLIAGAIGTIHFGGLKRRVFYTLVALSLIAPMAGVVGQGLVYHYRMPADPVFIAFGLAGFWRTGLGRSARPGS